MSLSNFFLKKTPNYDAASEFFVTPELVIHEGKTHGYTLAIDTGYEDLARTVKRMHLDGDEISIKTQTSYVDFQEVFGVLNIADAPKTAPAPKSKPTNLSSEKAPVANPLDGKDAVADETTVDASQPIEGSVLGADLPEQILLKQKDVVESDVYYKIIKVVSSLETSDDGSKQSSNIATSYYLTPISYIDGHYKQLSAIECSHIVETSWSDAYIEALSDDIEPVRVDKVVPVAGKHSKFKAPLIVAASLFAAIGSLYGYNFYQQNHNPLSLALSNGNVNTYMNAKSMNTEEYTQTQLEAAKATLASMGIDVSKEADIGCLIE